jgi:DNA-binding HxlR family transcriptional regulator
MSVLEWLGRRWTLRVLWELRDEPIVFRALQARCGGLSPTVLNERLRELREVGIVTVHADGGYTLTDDGRTLGELLVPLHRWADDWARRRLRRRAQS